MSYGYPDGCTQAMHDRAHGGETRPICDNCGGTGWVGIPCAPDGEEMRCSDCNGTGYEPVADNREDDAYEQRREDEDPDIDF
jgi:hypothetical protein